MSIPSLAGLLKPRDIKKETNFDIILRAWLEHRLGDLSEDLTAMLERWRMADSLLRDGYLVKKGKNEITQPYTFNKLVAFLVETYGISRRTAYDDIANAKKFFLSTYSKEDRDFARGVMIEWGEKMMWEAQSIGDNKSAAAFYKTLADIKGILKEEQERPDYENINWIHQNLDSLKWKIRMPLLLASWPSVRKARLT
jgi:predicted acetyltransferase